MVEVMREFIALRNRSAPQRLRGGHAPGQPREAFREWSLDVWRLAGEPGTWRGQLEAHMRERPVFALVGGIGTATWQPVHDFCEAEGVPCILPIVDQPPPEDGAYYSFYFSRGLHLEAEVVAAAVAAAGLGAEVVQVVGEAGLSAAAATTLVQALERRGGRVRTLCHRDGGLEVALSQARGAVVLWLTGEEVRRMTPGPSPAGGAPLFLSSTLLGGDEREVPASLHARGRLVHLSSLPDEPDPSLGRFRAWARARGLPAREERVQAHAYYAALAFSDAVKHMGAFVQRDYLVDLLDHASAMAAYLPLYTKAGMTPGQRVLSRGGWVIDLSGRLQSSWVVP